MVEIRTAPLYLVGVCHGHADPSKTHPTHRGVRLDIEMGRGSSRAKIIRMLRTAYSSR